MIISIVSLTGTLVNRFSTSSEANILLLGLIVWRTWINSCVNFMLHLLGKSDEISCFEITNSWKIYQPIPAEYNKINTAFRKNI